MVRNTFSTADLNEISLSDLQSILSRRIAEAQSKLPTLQARRDRIEAELAELESEIDSVSGPASSAPVTRTERGRKPGRPRRNAGAKRTPRSDKMTLPKAIQKVLEDAGKPLNLAEIREAILEKGLVKKPTKSFPAMVSMALSKGEQFVKVDRGVYALKG